jgi:hypothetical protein
MKPFVVRAIRRAHLHLGVFFAPLLLFFVLTGWYQTVTPDRRKGAADSDDWVSRLTRVHVEQYFPSKSAEGYSTSLFTTLVVVMSIASAPPSSSASSCRPGRKPVAGLDFLILGP